MTPIAETLSEAQGHTAGEWSYRSQQYDDWGIVRAGRYIICQARDPAVQSEEQLAAHRRAGTDPWEANARLIAAAPMLLEGASDALEALKLLRLGLQEITPVTIAMIDAHIDLLRTAISAAIGGTHE